MRSLDEGDNEGQESGRLNGWAIDGLKQIEEKLCQKYRR